MVALKRRKKGVSGKVTVLDDYRKKKVGLGGYIATARERRGLTQQQVVERLPGKVDRSVVSKWETGVLCPGPEDVVDIARAMNSPELLRRYCEGCAVCVALDKSLPKPAA